MSKAVIPAKLLRNTYRLLKSRSNWLDLLLVDQSTHNDSATWFECLKTWNVGALLIPHAWKWYKLQQTHQVTAGGEGVYHCELKHSGPGVWNTPIMHNSWNMREISAVLLCLQSFALSLCGKRVQILTDNITCAAYINYKGGTHADLSNVATQIWSSAIRQNLTFLPSGWPANWTQCQIIWVVTIEKFTQSSFNISTTFGDHIQWTGSHAWKSYNVSSTTVSSSIPQPQGWMSFLKQTERRRTIL